MEIFNLMEERLGLKPASKKYDIKVHRNCIGGRQGWAYICNSHEIPVLRANTDLPQEFINYREYEKVCVKYTWNGSEHIKYGTLALNEDKWQVHSSGCCIHSNFDMSDIIELVDNSHAPIVRKGDVVAVTYYSIKNSLAVIMLLKVGRIDSQCAVTCELEPLTDAEMKEVVKAAIKWCER